MEKKISERERLITQIGFGKKKIWYVECKLQSKQPIAGSWLVVVF